MKELIIYIAQANLALIVLAMLYKYVLAKDTHGVPIFGFIIS